MDYPDRITRDPDICGGEPVIQGTRVTLRTILASLAEGDSPKALLATVLTACGHDTDTVPEEDLAGKPDPDVWRETQQAGRFLITQDLDFSDIRQFRPARFFAQ